MFIHNIVHAFTRVVCDAHRHSGSETSFHSIVTSLLGHSTLREMVNSREV